MTRKKDISGVDKNDLLFWENANIFSLREAACLWCNRNPDSYMNKPLPKSIRDKACDILWLYVSSRTPEYQEGIKQKIWKEMKQQGKRRPPLKTFEVSREHMKYLLDSKLDLNLKWFELEAFASQLEESPVFLFNPDGTPRRKKEIAELPKTLTISALIWWLEDNRDPGSSFSANAPDYPSFHYLNEAVKLGFLDRDNDGRIRRSDFYKYLATEHGKFFAESFYNSNPVWGSASGSQGTPSPYNVKSRKTHFLGEFESWLTRQNDYVLTKPSAYILESQAVKYILGKCSLDEPPATAKKIINKVRSSRGIPNPKGGRGKKS